MLLPFTTFSFAEMTETEEDFSPFPGGYDYLVDYLPLSFAKESPSWEHMYEEVSRKSRGSALSGLLYFCPSEYTFYFRMSLESQKSCKDSTENC